MKKSAIWTRKDAQVLVTELEAYLKDKGWHVGLTGSVLFKSKSFKDLDLIIYPHCRPKTRNIKYQVAFLTLTDLLKSFGLNINLTSDLVQEFWRRKGSKDTKYVEVWKDSKGRRIDIMFLS